MPAWNKGQITGQKLPLKPREVWGMIRARLEAASNSREHEHTEPSTQPMKHREISGEDIPLRQEVSSSLTIQPGELSASSSAVRMNVGAVLSVIARPAIGQPVGGSGSASR
jgi:hypothetical protein